LNIHCFFCPIILKDLLTWTYAFQDGTSVFQLTLEEMIEKRKEAAKLRAQQSYMVAKARRQNKIKSKA